MLYPAELRVPVHFSGGNPFDKGLLRKVATISPHRRGWQDDFDFFFSQPQLFTQRRLKEAQSPYLVALCAMHRFDLKVASRLCWAEH
jgi:hypothetical protein